MSRIASFLVALLLPSQATASEFHADPNNLVLHNSNKSYDNSGCRCFPGEKCWPTESEWAAFNATVGGRLVATVPVASICHYDTLTGYDPDACAALRAAWGLPATHYTTSFSPMAAWFANDSCSPYTPPTSPCTIAAYSQYAVNATGKEEFQATLAFSTKRNIRLVIRNTGHDYMGKSTGAGALALWTHHLKDINLISEYSSKVYKGAAMKLGAGVQVSEAYAAADAVGLAVVGGSCQSVGIAGGYSQGGGLGPLSSTFGLGADQVLEWEVVTARGEHLIVSPTRHSDLYWALSGGGGGTYAAVLSMTIRAHPTMKVAGANLTFSRSGVSGRAYRKVVETFLSSLPSLTEAGTWSNLLLIEDRFELFPVLGPNLASAELQALLYPTLFALNQSGMAYEYHVGEHDTFKMAYDSMMPIINVTDANIGGRLIPRAVLDTQASLSSLMDTFESILSCGGVISGIVTNQTRFPLVGVRNSVNPALRTSVIDVVIGLAYNHADYEANMLAQEDITNNLIPQLEALTPGGGAYLNEGEINQPNWQEAFYGSNYMALEKVKDKYDPDELFYGLNSVGSERWLYRMHSDGRLCRISS